jgi:hypothetical protein
MKINQDRTITRLDDAEIKSILINFQSHRLHELYDNQSLADMHEVLVDIFKSEQWKDASRFDIRNIFIQSVRNLPASSDDHRRMFKAMAEASNSHAVISYLHMIGYKERVFLKDRSTLITTDDVSMMVRDAGYRIGPVIHFLCRASVVTQAESLPRLWRELNKGFDHGAKFKERFQEGMQTLVRRFGLKSLGIGKDDMDHQLWIDKFFHANEPAIKDVAAAVLAGQLASKKLNKSDLVVQCYDFSSKMRLVNDLDFDIEEFGGTKILRSHQIKQPSFRLEQGLTR